MSAPPRRSLSSRAARRRALYLTVFLAQLGTAAAVPILPALREEFGVSVAAVALVTSIWGLARLVFDLPIGAALDRLPPARMLLLGSLLIGAGSVIASVAPSFPVLLAGRAISGGGSAVISITTIVSLIELSEPASRGRTLGFYQAMLQAGSSLSPAMSGFASAVFGWRAAFWIAAVGAFGGTTMVWATGLLRDDSTRGGAAGAQEVAGAAAAPENGAPAASPTGAEPQAPRGPRSRSPLGFYLFFVNYATFIVFLTTGGLMQNAIPLFGGLEIGLNAAVIGLVIGASTAIRFGVNLTGNMLSDRYGRHPVLLLGFGLLAVSCLLFPLADSAVGFAVAAWAVAAGRLGNALPVVMLSDRVPHERSRRLVSVNRFVADSGLLLGPLLTGLLIEAAGFAPAFWVVSALAASVVALAVADLRVR